MPAGHSLSAERPVVAVATSGGRDSTALLHAVARQASAAGIEVLALHVHHGLQAGADNWLAHLQSQYKRWARQGWPLSFAFERLSGQPSPGESVEAWARRERYAALARMAKAHGVRHVLLAHHRGDQAETVLLQALRGAGPAGLAAMPKAAERAGVVWLRPWLSQPRAAIEAYVKRWRLSHIEDDSNQDPRFDRNRLRLEVLPALTRHFAQAEQALCDVAQHAASADAFIREASEHLLQPMLTSGGLDAEAWRQCSPVQRFWVLRHWLAQVVKGRVSGSLLERVTQEGVRLQQARWPLVDGLELRLYRGQLSVETVLDPPAPDTTDLADVVRWPTSASAGQQYLPAWRGTLRWSVVREHGVTPASLEGAVIASRAGREQFQIGPGRPARSLKKQFQALGVPQWARSGPLVWQGDQLVFVPGLGIDARCHAARGEPQLVLHWHPDSSDVPPID